MTLKLVLISPSGTLFRDKVLNDADIQELCGVIAQLVGVGIRVAIWSNRKWNVTSKIEGVPPVPLHVYMSTKSGCEVQAVGSAATGFPYRQKAKSVEPILQKFNVNLEETILVGANDEDLQAGVNNKLLLLRPAWYGGDLKYGFELKSISELGRFCALFGARQHPFYWRAQHPARFFSMNALGPFSTYIEKFAGFGQDALQAAKFEAGTLSFWHQLVASTLYFSGLMHEVDFITVFPGHAAVQKEKAFYDVLRLLGNCFQKPFLPDLLTRHADAIKSTTLKAGQRKFGSQINTIKLNQYPKKPNGAPRIGALKLAGKCVLVVDDICTSGRSLDTARGYLSAAGARTILFAWLKTVNTDFESIEPLLALKPFSENTVMAEPASISYDYSAHIVDKVAAEEIQDLLEKYQKWPV